MPRWYTNPDRQDGSHAVQNIGLEACGRPRKDLAFATCFHALGVEFNLENVCNGVFTVGNTSSRKEELGARLDDELDPAVAVAVETSVCRGPDIWATCKDCTAEYWFRWLGQTCGKAFRSGAASVVGVDEKQSSTCGPEEDRNH